MTKPITDASFPLSPTAAPRPVPPQSPVGSDAELKLPADSDQILRVDVPLASIASVEDLAQGVLAPTLIRASAGTGKTYRLTARLLRILLQGAAPESILATTFTRKAAGEILDRLLLQLARAADPDDSESLEAIREQVGIPTLPRSACLQLLDRLLRNVHRLRICTLDSFFAQLARSFPFELGLPPAWRLTDEIEEVWFREQAVDSVIGHLEPAEMTAMLAMLGKGETRRSIARELLQVVGAAYSVQRGCSADAWTQVVAPKMPDSADLTRAAGMLRQAEPTQKRLRTKLASMADMLEQREFKPLFQDQLMANIAKARRSGDEVTYYRSKFPEGLDETFDVVYASVRSAALSLLSAQNDATGAVLEAYDHHVLHLKKAVRAIGFDDVAVLLASQFASIDHRVLHSRMDGAIDHVLLDEFQDTSPIQWQVIRPLAIRVAKPPESEQLDDEREMVPTSFFCVGDTKQAIYGWRGGVAEIFDAVAEQVPGVCEQEQNTSYRSSPVVIDVVNDVFNNLHQHPLASDVTAPDPASKSYYEGSAIRKFAERFPTHITAKDSLPGHVRFETARKIDPDEFDDPETPRNTCFEDAARLVQSIWKRAPHKTVGVLTRTNRSVAHLIFLLEQLGVEVSQEGGNPLTDSAAVELVLSAFMMAEHPGDRRWQFHVEASPLAEIPGLDAALIRDRCEDHGIAQTVEFLAGALAPYCSPRDIQRFKQLAHLAIEYELNPAPRLRDFVRLVREKRVERPQMAPVRVMTVHQAKGLEFDAVVLPELDVPLSQIGGNSVADSPHIGEPPRGMTRYMGYRSWHFLSDRWQRAFGRHAAASMTESLCLLYVAMTRARQALHLMIQPALKPTFDTRTAASLVFHALGCDADPTLGNSTLLECGDPEWWDHDSRVTDEDSRVTDEDGSTQD